METRSQATLLAELPVGQLLEIRFLYQVRVDTMLDVPRTRLDAPRHLQVQRQQVPAGTEPSMIVLDRSGQFQGQIQRLQPPFNISHRLRPHPPNLPRLRRHMKTCRRRLPCSDIPSRAA